MNGDPSKWTPEQDAALRLEYLNTDGVSLEPIAKKLSRSVASVACRASRLGISSRRGKNKRTGAAKENMSVAQRIRAESSEEKSKRSSATKAWIDEKGHPKGATGFTPTRQHREAVSKATRAMWADPKSKVNSKKYRDELSTRFSALAAKRPAANAFSRTKKGFRDDIGISVRSAWEANYARYLNWLIAKDGKIEKWEYEPETFWFEKIKRGCRSYKPDFRITFTDGKVEYHEVKGWMTPRSKTALKRMSKYHPSVKIVLIDSKRYRAIDRTARLLIENWE